MLTPAQLEAHNRGIRHVQLVHYTPNDIGDFQTGATVHRGLTSFGAEVIRACHRLGFVCDVAHATEDTVKQARPLIRTLLFAVIVVLLIVCANLAGLLLVRSIRRRREIAVRLAPYCSAEADHRLRRAASSAADNAATNALDSNGSPMTTPASAASTCSAYPHADVVTTGSPLTTASRMTVPVVSWRAG